MDSFDLERSPREIRCLCLHRCVDAQICERAPDDSTRKPQVLMQVSQLSSTGLSGVGFPTACAIDIASPRTAMLIRAKGRNALSVKT